MKMEERTDEIGEVVRDEMVKPEDGRIRNGIAG